MSSIIYIISRTIDRVLAVIVERVELWGVGSCLGSASSRDESDDTGSAEGHGRSGEEVGKRVKILRSIFAVEHSSAPVSVEALSRQGPGDESAGFELVFDCPSGHDGDPQAGSDHLDDCLSKLNL